MPIPAPDLLVRTARLDERVPLGRMLELYQHDLSDLWDQDLDAQGEYGYWLDDFWQRPGHVPFVATVAGRYAGFALVDDRMIWPPDANANQAAPTRWMTQFFVLRKYRRRGVGDALARQVFAALPGRWQVGQMMGNLPAQAFWRRVIGEVTAGQFDEHTLSSGHWQGVLQCFDNSRPGAA